MSLLLKFFLELYLEVSDGFLTCHLVLKMLVSHFLNDFNLLLFQILGQLFKIFSQEEFSLSLLLPEQIDISFDLIRSTFNFFNLFC